MNDKQDETSKSAFLRPWEATMLAYHSVVLKLSNVVRAPYLEGKTIYHFWHKIDLTFGCPSIYEVQYAEISPDGGIFLGE